MIAGPRRAGLRAGAGLAGAAGRAMSRTAERRDALRATAAASRAGRRPRHQPAQRALPDRVHRLERRAAASRPTAADLFGTDGRYTTQAGGAGARRRAAGRPRHGAGAGPRGRARAGSGRLGYESHDVTVDGLAALEKVLADAAAGGRCPSWRRSGARSRPCGRSRTTTRSSRCAAPARSPTRRWPSWPPRGRCGPAAPSCRSAGSSTPGCCAGRRGAVLRDDRGHRRQLGDPAPPARRHRTARRRLPQAGLRRDRRRLPLRHDPHRRPGARRGLAAGDLRAGRGLPGGRPGGAGGRRGRRRGRRGLPRRHRRGRAR